MITIERTENLYYFLSLGRMWFDIHIHCMEWTIPTGSAAVVSPSSFVVPFFGGRDGATSSAYIHSNIGYD